LTTNENTENLLTFYRSSPQPVKSQTADLILVEELERPLVIEIHTRDINPGPRQLDRPIPSA
jgi:hypothetical protein